MNFKSTFRKRLPLLLIILFDVVVLFSMLYLESTTSKTERNKLFTTCSSVDEWIRADRELVNVHHTTKQQVLFAWVACNGIVTCGAAMVRLNKKKRR